MLRIAAAFTQATDRSRALRGRHPKEPSLTLTDVLDQPPELAEADARPAHSRQLLTHVWRSALERLTELSMLLHSLTGDDKQRAAIESKLAETRRTLVEVEAALDRLRATRV